MEDNCSFTLNLASRNKPDFSLPKVKPASTEYPSDRTPIVSFVSKPKSESTASVKKPTFRVLRKKASLSNKKNVDLTAKFNPKPPQISVNNNVTDKTSAPTVEIVSKEVEKSSNLVESVPEKVSNTFPPKLGSKAGLQPSNGMPRKTKPSTAPTNRTVISSLFKFNPEIPVVQKETVETTKETVFSIKKFSDLGLHNHLVATLEKDLGLANVTEAQLRTIPVLLDKKDALVKSQTGSGKTLAYAIPIVQKLQCIMPKIDRTSGVFALIIVPTRELVLQTYSWFTKILKAFTWVVPGYLIGGEKKKSEKARIRKGMNILISTPGRLLDHLSSTKNLNLGRLHWLVMDEADRLFDMGYEKDVAKIMKIVEEHFVKEGGFGRRQNVMVSATLTKSVEKLAGLTLTDPVHVTMSEEGTVVDDDQLVTPTNLKQWYIIVPPKLRLVTLAAFILWKCTAVAEKMVIFMTTQDMVDYHAELFNRILAKNGDQNSTEKKVSFYQLHGSMAQKISKMTNRRKQFTSYHDSESK